MLPPIEPTLPVPARPEWNAIGADHDQAFQFGHSPRPDRPEPFTSRQLVRLMLLRSRLGDRILLRGRRGAVGDA